MKKSVILLSTIAALSIPSFASEDIKLQLELLKNQIKQLEDKMTANEDKVKKVEKIVKKNKSNITKNKILANNDNIKWDVNLRTSFDSLSYKHASGATSKNPDLLSTRLWLGMGYTPDENHLFKGKLSYHKAFGDTANHAQSNTNPGYADFDWVTNENLTDNTIKVKEAYWLYMNDTFLDTQVPWTVSIGRRPSTDGLGINMREGMKDNSPLSHTVNVEFDGLSSKFNLDKLTGVDGMWWKLCTGRGLTNAKSRFQSNNADYSKDQTHTSDIDMFGFIFVPYDDGQYSIHTNWARAVNLIGFDQPSIQSYGAVMQGINPRTGVAYTNTEQALSVTDKTTYAPQFKDHGNIDLFTVMFKAEGIGDGISDFLDNTTVFASWAQSKTDPANGMAMLGSTNSETGHSEWIGLNMPCPLTEDGRLGIEWNKGSKYWRSVTYGEDTMTGSKIATRGTAWEIYYNKPLTKALHLNARYTKIDYDYTGSQAFFGFDGNPTDMSTINATNAAQFGDPVKESQNIKLSISYKY